MTAPSLFLALASIAGAALAALGYALASGWYPWRFVFSVAAGSLLGYLVTACLHGHGWG